MKEYGYQLWQDGIMVAEVSGTSLKYLDHLQREILHYAMMFGQDGPVEIKARRGTPKLPSKPKAASQ